MIKLGDRKFLVESISDLPSIPSGGSIFADCETRSRDDSLRSAGSQPYLGDRAAMWCVCWETGPAYAIPIRMRDGKNVEIDPALRWLSEALSSAAAWVNHNVKFDAHFARIDGVRHTENFKCTLTLAKLVNSDRMSHGLKDLCRDWLLKDYSSEDRVLTFLDSYRLPKRAKARDYALVPTDLLADYGCDDVLHNRDLYDYCMRELPDSVRPTWEMERQLTPVLFDMEVLGLRTDETMLKTERLRSIMKQVTMATRLNELSGLEYAGSSKYAYSLLCGAWGLPVLSVTKDGGNPSFDAETLQLYLVHPEVVADPVKSEGVKTMLAIRKEETYLKLFVESFIENRDSRGYIHTTYNQTVRTGRMSAKDPNTQQFDERAKLLVLADSDEDAFDDWDASQIEFRYIAHYMGDERIIKAYNDNPETDIHDAIAKMSGLKRRPAKTLNFSVAFGAGKKNTVSQLASDEHIVAEVSAEIDAMIASGAINETDRMREFARRTWIRGEEVFRRYHEMFPSLRRVSDAAAAAARSRGYVFNLYGRRRHLPPKAAHVAFNTLCQGGAGDLVKRRIIQLAPRYNEVIRSAGVTLRASVHDSIVFHGKPAALASIRDHAREILQQREPRLSVPVYWAHKTSQGCWGTKK